MEGIRDFVETVLSWWPYWVPVLCLVVGFNVGSSVEVENRDTQLKRLARNIPIPEGLEEIEPYVGKFDGVPLSRQEMALSALVIRTGAGGLGSAVAVSRDGLVLTNHHVVGDSAIVEVEVEGNSFLGRVIRRDEKRDVALIKVTYDRLVVPQISRSLLEVGEDLFISGTPNRPENANMLTKGIVSKIGLSSDLNFIHFDASVDPGNSGGPVYTSEGLLVGLTVAIQLDNEGAKTRIGMGIPIAEALDALKLEFPPLQIA